MSVLLSLCFETLFLNESHCEYFDLIQQSVEAKINTFYEVYFLSKMFMMKTVDIGYCR